MKSAAALPFRLACALALALSAHPVPAAEPSSPEAKLLPYFTARPIGPSNMGGRIVGVAVVEGRPATQYIATASGGLWKTTNNGGSWAPMFDHENTISLGAVAVAPSNPDVVWLGTGEANARNSVSWGDGVYKSTDGGVTWKNMGLTDTHHIARVVIHPHNPDIVYVAALGHLWGSNRERGLYKTVDGGQTWGQVKFINEDTGFIDLAMDPADPETLYAAAYRVRRGYYSGGNPAVQFSPDSGLFKTTDAGKTWVKLTHGLPDRPLGRCGIDIYRKDPRFLYAVVPTDKTDIRNVPGQPPKPGSNAETGGVFRSADRGATWAKVNDLCPRPFYFGQIRIDPQDDQRLYVLGVAMHFSRDGGKTFRTMGSRFIHADQHALWINPHDSAHLVMGCDGGVYFSYDKGATWEHLKNMPLGQFYAIGVDMRKPYRVYGGLQDNGSWGGPSATPSAEGITIADWYRVHGADGFYCQVDPTDPDTVYAEAQYGRLHRLNIRTGTDNAISPVAPKGSPEYRFNWSAPLLLSRHNPRTLYYGGDHLFRSNDRGDTWEVLSPDLTRGKPGPSTYFGHTLTTIAESPVKAGVLYAGSDDGLVHASTDGGKSWLNVSDRVPGVPANRWITRVECSHFDAGTAYLSIDRHRNDDRRAYLFKTQDNGTSWVPIAGDLPPDGPVHVVREDPRNRNLLFVGTEFGLFVSRNGGAAWHRLPLGQEEKPADRLRTVAVHDLVIHPRDRELVIATHGRSIYVMDVAPLEDLTDAVLAAPVYLFDVKPATLFRAHGSHGLTGGRVYAAPNPPFGASIQYYLKDKAKEAVRVVILNAQGKPVVELKGPADAGLKVVTWNLRPAPPKGATEAEGPVVPGEYQARLETGVYVLTKKFRVEGE